MTNTNDPFLPQGDGTTPPAAPSWEPQPMSTEQGTMPVAAQPAAPAYGAPPQQYASPSYATAQQTAYYPPVRPAKTWMNITSLVTSLVGLGLLGVIFGHLGVAAAKRGEADYKGLGIAGLILGYLGIVGTILYIAFMVVAFGTYSTTV